MRVVEDRAAGSGGVQDPWRTFAHPNFATRGFMNMKALYSLVLLAALAAGNAYAACTYPTAPADIPDGNTATLEQMVAAQKAVKEFDQEINAYTACLKLESDAAIAKVDQGADERRRRKSRRRSWRACRCRSTTPRSKRTRPWPRASTSSSRSSRRRTPRSNCPKGRNTRGNRSADTRGSGEAHRGAPRVPARSSHCRSCNARARCCARTSTPSATSRPSIAWRWMASRFKATRRAAARGATGFRPCRPRAIPPLTLAARTSCIEVMTGAVLPADCDAVVPVEQITSANGEAELAADVAVEAWQNVHRRGTRLAPGRAAAVGRHAAVGTGGRHRGIGRHGARARELAADGGGDLHRQRAHRAGRADPAASDPSLERLRRRRARCAGRASSAWRTITCRTMPAQLRERLKFHLDTHDVLVLSGGVSMGRFDLVPRALRGAGRAADLPQGRAAARQTAVVRGRALRRRGVRAARQPGLDPGVPRPIRGAGAVRRHGRRRAGTGREDRPRRARSR